MERIDGSNTLNADLLRKLTEAKGPCVTILLPATAESDLRVQLKDAVRTVHENLHKTRAGESHQELLAPLAEEMEPVPVSQRSNGSLVVLRSPELFVRFFTPAHLHETVTVEDYFAIRHLLPILDEGKEFYLLALSQKRTRFLLCTAHSSDEVPLPPGTPTSLHEAMNTRQPDHVLDNRASGGPSVGSMKGVMFGTSSDQDDKYEDLHQFFRAVDKGVNALLHGLSVPVIPVGVEHELAQYRRANTYPHLVEPGIHGAPDGMKGGEMHRRALILLQSHTASPVQKALDEFDKSVGTGHASTHAQEIVKAAHEGRISHLFVQDEAEYLGNFDEVRQKVKRHEDALEPRHDLLNDAAIQTIRHGGLVSVLPPAKMPNGVPVCALYRYAATHNGTS